MVKNGNLKFWKKAAQNSDFVYKELMKDDAWIIDDDLTEIDKSKYAGPFILYVSVLMKNIKFYGKIDKYKESQKEIERKIDNCKVSPPC